MTYFDYRGGAFTEQYTQVPVILVGNKIDLRGGQVTNEALEDEIIPIMNEFKVRVSYYVLPLLTTRFRR